jgi:hypothetical protein
VWGWKAVERLIEPSVSLEEARQILEQQGFRLHASQPSLAIFKRTGLQNPWLTAAPSGSEVPIELAIAQSHSGLYPHVRYETFVLFDTGDLERLADEAAALLKPAVSLA